VTKYGDGGFGGELAPKERRAFFELERKAAQARGAAAAAQATATAAATAAQLDALPKGIVHRHTMPNSPILAGQFYSLDFVNSVNFTFLAGRTYRLVMNCRAMQYRAGTGGGAIWRLALGNENVADSYVHCPAGLFVAHRMEVPIRYAVNTSRSVYWRVQCLNNNNGMDVYTDMPSSHAYIEDLGIGNWTG
jgi:hypothetical protein